VSEQACPFCGRKTPASFRATLPPKVPVGRRSRAALYALGASALTATTACGGEASGGNAADAAMEEASATGDSGNTPPRDAAADVPDGTYGGVPLYGGPFPVDDSGTADDGGDGGGDAGIGIHPLYGAAPLPHPFAIRDRINK
jgi:hypothetical protein